MWEGRLLRGEQGGSQKKFGISFLSAGGGMGRITLFASGKQGGSYEDNDIFQDLHQI